MTSKSALEKETTQFEGAYWRDDDARGGGGFPWDFLVGVYSPVLEIMTLFLTEKCHFPHPFLDLASKIHTLFQIWRWSQNATLHYMFT